MNKRKMTEGTRCRQADYWTLSGRMTSPHVLPLWCFHFTGVSLTASGAGHGLPLSHSCAWQCQPKNTVAQRTKETLRKGFMDHRAGGVLLSSLKTSRSPLAKHNLVKAKQHGNMPLKEKTSALWSRGSCVLSSSFIGSRFENLLSLSEQLHVCVSSLVLSCMQPVCKAQS